jgi:hypothetical protein
VRCDTTHQLPSGPRAQVKRRDVQVRAAHGRHAVHGPQVARVALHQRAGQQPAPAAAGGRTRRPSHGPAGGCAAARRLRCWRQLSGDHQREQVQRPGPLRSVGVGIDVVGDAVVAHLALQVDGAAVQVVEAVAAQVVEEAGPVRRQGSALAVAPTLPRSSSKCPAAAGGAKAARSAGAGASAQLNRCDGSSIVLHTGAGHAHVA